MPITQPMGQKILTNISVVRLKKAGQKFEIAAYPNMVSAWRKGDETDISEVLQIDRVYKDVERGEFAKTKDLDKAFGKNDQKEICMEILASGEVQLSEKERTSAQAALLKEICTIVSDKCVNPQSKRPVTVGVVERALSEMHFNANISKPAKKQALEAIKLLEGKYPIERAPMRIKMSLPLSRQAELEPAVDELAECVERKDENGGMWNVVLRIHPDKYRACDAIVTRHRSEGSTIEVVELSVHKEGEAAIETEQARPRGGEDAQAQANVRRPQVSPSDRSDGFKSSTAPGMIFATREELTAHMKSDFHKHNLKLKSEGKPMMSRDEFTEWQILSSG